MAFSTITVLSILLPAVFAVPYQPRHGHHTGTAPHPTRTYGSANATYGPTGSGTGTGAYPYSTLTVVPLPATNSSSDLPTYTSALTSSSISESSIVEALTSASASECGSPTVTVTSSALVTITVTSSDSATAGQSTSSLLSSYVYQSIGTTSSIVSDTTSSAAPSSVLSSSAASSSAASSTVVASSAASFSASSYAEQSSATSYNAAQSSASVVASTPIYKGYSPVSLPTSSATSYLSVSSQADGQSVSSSASSASSATSTTSISSTTLTTSTSSTVGSMTTQAYASPTITASSVSSGSGSGKRGLAYSIGQASYATHYSSATGIPWAYNWEATRESELPSHIEFVPMLHGPDDARTKAWPDAASNAIKAGSKHLMGVNEPDQNNWSPASIAKLHNSLMNPHSNGGSIKIGSPGVTQGTGPAGVGWGTTWLQNFKTECGKIDGDCIVDFVPVHWYLHIDKECGDATVKGCIEGFKKYVDKVVSDVHNIWPNANIWLDEFQIWSANVAQQTDFLNQMLPWLDAHPGVERYSYFQLAPFDAAASPPQFHMIGPDGNLNDVGNAYTPK